MTPLDRTTTTLRAIGAHKSWPWLQIVGTAGFGAALAMKWMGKAEGSDFYAVLLFCALLMRPDKLVALARAKYGKPDA